MVTGEGSIGVTFVTVNGHGQPLLSARHEYLFVSLVEKQVATVFVSRRKRPTIDHLEVVHPKRCDRRRIIGSCILEVISLNLVNPERVSRATHNKIWTMCGVRRMKLFALKVKTRSRALHQQTCPNQIRLDGSHRPDVTRSRQISRPLESVCQIFSGSLRGTSLVS